MGSTRYIMSMGELSRKDNSLCFRKDGKNVYLPVENTKEIYCFNEVSINTKLLDFLAQNNIIVHFFNYYGGYSGTYYPRDHYLSGKLLVKQVEKFTNDRMSVAKAIVKGIGLNIYEILYHYYKHDKKEVKETIDWIKQNFFLNVEQAQEIKELLVNKKWYYSIFDGIDALYVAISHSITDHIVELAERYEDTLPTLSALVDDYEARVKSHLERMGFKW